MVETAESCVFLRSEGTQQGHHRLLVQPAVPFGVLCQGAERGGLQGELERRSPAAGGGVSKGTPTAGSE